MSKLVLLDGHSLAFRAFYALPPEMATAHGELTNAVYGFTSMLLSILQEEKPEYIAVAFDVGRTFRHDLSPDYKGTRARMPEEMRVQLPRIRQVIDALNIPVFEIDGYEADDLIGTLARKAERAGYDVVIVTGDKDMFQLLSPHVRIYDPVKDRWFGEAECRERFGVEPARVVEIMGLMGDATDNIPGVKGIGEKTAMKLIAQFGTIDELLNRLDEVTPERIKTMLAEQGERDERDERRAASASEPEACDYPDRQPGGIRSGGPASQTAPR